MQEIGEIVALYFFILSGDESVLDSFSYLRRRITLLERAINNAEEPSTLQKCMIENCNSIVDPLYSSLRTPLVYLIFLRVGNSVLLLLVFPMGDPNRALIFFFSDSFLRVVICFLLFR